MKRTRWLMLLLVALLVSACGRGQSPTATPTPTPTPLPTATATPEPTPGEALPEGLRSFTLVPGASRAEYQAEEEFLSGAVQQLGKALGITSTVGATDQIQGHFTLDVSDGLQIVDGLIQVNISTLTSDDPRRDRALRERFLESQIFPMATFVPLEVEDFPQTYTLGEEVAFELIGDLTIREVTQRVRFDMRARYDGQRLRGEADAVLRMSQFGFDPPAIGNLFVVADEFLLKVFFVAQETTK